MRARTHVEQDETAKAVADLARRFTALVRASGVSKTAIEERDGAADLDPWITEARACGAPAIATFASGLTRPTSSSAPIRIVNLLMSPTRA